MRHGYPSSVAAYAPLSAWRGPKLPLHLSRRFFRYDLRFLSHPTSEAHRRARLELLDAHDGIRPHFLEPVLWTAI